MTSHLLCLGFGYCAQQIDHLIATENQDWQLSGSYRTQPPPTNKAHQFQLNDKTARQAAFAQATHLLISAPPSDKGDPIYHAFQAEIKQAATQGKLGWIGYYSTTGVYGDHQGAWVTEESPLLTQQQRSLNRLKAEQQWQDLANISGIQCALMRLSGIYGPNRNPLSKLQTGTAKIIDKEGQFFSRIHVEDIAALTLALAEQKQGGIYNFADQQPATSKQVIEYAASLLDVTAPTPMTWEVAKSTLSPMGQSFYAENKRVQAQKVLETTGLDLRHPTYKAGLEQLLSSIK